MGLNRLAILGFGLLATGFAMQQIGCSEDEALVDCYRDNTFCCPTDLGVVEGSPPAPEVIDGEGAAPGGCPGFTMEIRSSTFAYARISTRTSTLSFVTETSTVYLDPTQNHQTCEQPLDRCTLVVINWDLHGRAFDLAVLDDQGRASSKVLVDLDKLDPLRASPHR